MTSINNDFVDLTLALGYSDLTVQTRLNNDSGAGVNAEGSRLQHIFAASDPLSELVWSPRKGPSLKRADNSFANTKPFLLWNLTPNTEVSTPSDVVKTNGINDEKEKDVEEGSAEVKKNVTMNKEKDLLLSQNNQMTEKGDEDGENCATEALKIQSLRRSGPIVASEPNSILQKEGGSGSKIRYSDDNDDMKNSDMEEKSAENERRLIMRNKTVPIEVSETQTRTCPRKRKGKMRALSDGDNAKSRTSSSEESSHESVESCNSTKMFREPLFSGTKRVKKQMQINDSSFMTWISNMVNGLSKLREEVSFGEPKDVFLDDDKAVIDVSPIRCHRANDGSKEQIFDKATNNTSDRGCLNNFWISHFSVGRDEATKCENSNPNDRNEPKSMHKLNPIIPSPKCKSSEAMTSTFARRLGALKHIVSPNAINEENCAKAVCVFCGRSGHDMSNCSETTESEREDILKNISAYDWNENTTSNSGETVLKGTSALPLSTFGSKETASVPKGAFDAIRRLRLSRGDILKWLNSNASLSHLDGFFLRLRLGRWDNGQGKTGYYIARIAASQSENSADDTNKSISVSFCGITCTVGSQYISNHDFLEEELVTWWHKTTESRGQIPSEDELRSKVESRMKSGF